MGRLPKPYRKTTTLGALYRKYLLEDAPSDDFIREAIRTESPRRLMVISLVLNGYSPEQISGALGNTRQAVGDMVRKTMRQVWKRINNMPRYYLKGRKAKSA